MSFIDTLKNLFGGAKSRSANQQTTTLAVYQALDHPGLFLPFRDATSDTETYGAGRYLEPHDLGGGELLVDFNLAYNGQHR
jgi:hypothetical protein